VVVTTRINNLYNVDVYVEHFLSRGTKFNVVENE